MSGLVLFQLIVVLLMAVFAALGVVGYMKGKKNPPDTRSEDSSNS